MTQKEITIQGKSYPVIFTLKTIMGFEDIVGHSFFEDKLEKISSRMALVIASIIAADENADISADKLMNVDNWATIKDITEGFVVVMNLAGDFFKIPEVAKEDEKPADAEESEKSKN